MAKGNQLSTDYTEIGGQYPTEVANIRKARLADLTTPAKKLAKKLVYSGGRSSVLSVYSVIRRFDAARKANGL